MSRFRILAIFVALVALTSVLAACGGGSSDDPQTIVNEATLQGIESANLMLRGELDLNGSKGGHLAFELAGPFQSESEVELPELDLTASAKGHVSGEKIDFDGGLTLLGDKAFVAYEGTEYEVDPTTFTFVRSLLKQKSAEKGQSGEIAACREAVSEVKVSDFIENLKGRSGGTRGGVETTEVTGDLNVGGAIDALVELSEDPACHEQLSAASGVFPSSAELEKAKRTAEESIKGATVAVSVGDDHIVRSILVQAPRIEPPKTAGRESGVKSAGFELDLVLEGVNEEQTIAAPKNSKPLSALFVKLGINPLELLGLLEGSAGGLNGPGGLNHLLERIGSGGIQ